MVVVVVVVVVVLFVFSMQNEQRLHGSDMILCYATEFRVVDRQAREGRDSIADFYWPGAATCRVAAGLCFW